MLPAVTNNKEKTFWFLQISGWTIFYFQHIFVFSPIKDLTFYNLLVRAAILAIGFLLTLLLRFRLKKIDFLKYSFNALSVIIFISSLICATIWFWSNVLISESLKFNKITFGAITLREIIVGITRDNVVFIGWIGLYFGIKFWMEWVSQKEKTDKAVLLTRNAQLEMLRYQLNPHFLFNTLTSLRALITDENKRAKEIIIKISEFLRYALIEGNNNEVALSKEIDVIKNYLDIEKIRFEDKLIVDFHIDQLSENYTIPIFLVHPLVENAIKHGMQTSPIPLKIIITVKMIEDFLYISVFNTGKWIERRENEVTGRGLENIKQRLELFSPFHHDFQLVKNENSVEVKMVLKKR